VPLPNQKLTAKNWVAANSEIGSQKLYRCRFINRQKNYGVADSELAANCAAADSEINNQKLCRCRFRNQ